MPDEYDELFAPLPPDAPWWAKWMVANASEAWKWASVWWPAVCAAAVEIYAQDKDAINQFARDNIPPGWLPHILAGAFGVSILARVIKQSKRK